MKNVRGEARRGNARVPPSPLRAIDLESSVNPSAGSRARRKPTRFRRTISWWDLSRPSTNGARPLPRHECIKRERYSYHEFPLFAFNPNVFNRLRSLSRSRRENIPDTFSRYPFPESGIPRFVFGTQGARWNRSDLRREKEGKGF